MGLLFRRLIKATSSSLSGVYRKNRGFFKIVLLICFIGVVLINLSSVKRNNLLSLADDLDLDINHGQIDYHDYRQMKIDEERHRPGDHGSAVILDPSDAALEKELWAVNGFNALISDKIPLDRSLKDIRHPLCLKKKYPRNLPSVSIIIPFHQEHFSVLIRTVTSLLNRAPPGVIKEIILADDVSTKEFLKKELDDYVAKHFDNVKVFRESKRQGLMRNRLIPAKIATGDVLIFLDSHCEANINWLPPLLEPIIEDYRTVVCPFIDGIDMYTYEYKAQDEGMRGAFEWYHFNYKRLPRLPQDAEHPIDPFASPVMAGGLFAISRKWFFELGGYDPGLEVWGGEQYELSFKAWQCGGSVVDAPCSRIGHIYRKFAPNNNTFAPAFYIARNFRRVAEVWMDEYKQYLLPDDYAFKTLDPYDLTEQKAVRQRLKCKGFDWYMKNVAFDILEYYPYITPPAVAEGQLINNASGLCVQANNMVVLTDCLYFANINDKNPQYLRLTHNAELRVFQKGSCVDSQGRVNDKSDVLLYECHRSGGNQYWWFSQHNNMIKHTNGYCLEAQVASKRLLLSHCDSTSATQKWTWSKINMTMWESLNEKFNS